ncbi:MAG: glycosyltransferase family 39 protein, partial [Anaerolineae bacterium]|nr:glycosyltransferase family 39 protein [Anaerolineae bacterium]
MGVILVAFLFRFYRIADYPLGLFFDPAINGLDAVRLIQRGGYVLFFPTNGGRESLFMYLLIPFIRFFGTTPFSIRALTATISLLTVVLLIAFLRNDEVRTMNDESKETRLQTPNSQLSTSNPQLSIINYQLSIVSGFVLATLPWHIAVTRLGQRPILAPMLAIPIFWFFLKGWRGGQSRWFVLSGLFMGLAGYTYSAARLLPVILVMALLPEFFIQPIKRANVKRTAVNLVL